MTGTLGQLLTTLRAERGLSLRGLAHRAGIAHSTLGRWEKGTHLPRLPELEAALSILNATGRLRQQALTLLDAPRALAQTREETLRRAPAFVEAAGGLPGNGELLRVLRIRAGKTLETAAREMGVTASTLSRWERSEMRPGPARLHMLCLAMGANKQETAALTSSEDAAAFRPGADSAAQIATLGLGMYEEHRRKPPAALNDLTHFGLEAQAWRLLPQGAEAKNVLFALYYWQMKTFINTARYEQAVPYVQKVLTLTETMPDRITVPMAEREAFVLEAREAQSRASIYQALIAGQRAPASRPHHARRLARQWRTAHDAYFSAWMMSEAARLLANAGENETARDWSRQACKEADTGDAAHWTEALFRRRDYAEILTDTGRSEDALDALEASAALNSVHPDCLARYHLLRTKIYLDLKRSAQAHEALSQASRTLKASQLVYLQASVETLERRF